MAPSCLHTGCDAMLGNSEPVHQWLHSAFPSKTYRKTNKNHEECYPVPLQALQSCVCSYDFQVLQCFGSPICISRLTCSFSLPIQFPIRVICPSLMCKVCPLPFQAIHLLWQQRQKKQRRYLLWRHAVAQIWVYWNITLCSPQISVHQQPADPVCRHCIEKDLAVSKAGRTLQFCLQGEWTLVS